MLPSPMRLQKGRYVARFAECETDLSQALRLRAELFRPGGQTSDRDKFDALSAHMLVEDSETGALMCCFRMMTFETGKDATKGYSGQYYDLTKLANQQGPLVEIGRFCIANGANDPDLLRVAWGGVTRYVDALGVTLLFGCSSFAEALPRKHQETLIFLKDECLAPVHWAPGSKAAEVYHFAHHLADQSSNRRAALKGMPTLLRTYLGMGGWVSDHAVIDRDLNTLHVFTGVEIASIPAARARALRAVID